MLLHIFYRVSFKNWFLCADDVNVVRCESLRQSILEYFDNKPKLEQGQVTVLTFAQENNASQPESLLVSCLMVLYWLKNILKTLL